jgi:hypothetical protein
MTPVAAVRWEFFYEDLEYLLEKRVYIRRNLKIFLFFSIKSVILRKLIFDNATHHQ